jgi:hypothetical protein
MNLPPPAPRRHEHTRKISCEAYRREDGLWDIEARIVDTKPFSYQDPFRGLREPGEAVHDMALRLTIDKGMTVRDRDVATMSAPYAPGFEVAPVFNGLIGKKIGAGWRRTVHECVGGVKGCTHLRELLLPVATVAIQAMGDWPKDRQAVAPPAADNKTERPHFIDGCKAWAGDGEVVATLYPHFHRKTD